MVGDIVASTAVGHIPHEKVGILSIAFMHPVASGSAATVCIYLPLLVSPFRAGSSLHACYRSRYPIVVHTSGH